MKNSSALVPVTSPTVARPSLKSISQVARYAARQQALASYHDGLTDNTRIRHLCDLQVFSDYLVAANLGTISAEDFMYDLTAWEGANEGLVAGFKQWMIQEGHAIGSVNVRLGTVKKYCELAANAGHVDVADLGLIKNVHGYRGREGRNVDKRRETTRVGNKKATSTLLTVEQADQLLDQSDSRDALMMYLFLRLGLRVGEVAALKVEDFDLSTGHLRFYREKVDKTQEHALRWNGVEMVRHYLDQYQPPADGKLFIGKDKIVNEDTGEVNRDYTVRALQKRVTALGKRIGVGAGVDEQPLSPHDLRHHWAWRMAKNKTHVRDMQDAGGWSSPYMPLRYAESTSVANEGVVL